MTRAVLFAAGAIALGVLWAGPLPGMAPSRFSAHMAMHMGVVALAAPLIALGLAGGRFDPTRRAPGVFNPIAASIFELAAVWGWHAPALHHAARHATGALVLEQMTFLAAGLWLWLAAVGAGRGARVARAWTGVAGLLFTSIHMTLLRAVFVLTPRALYSPTTPDTLWEQHLGGGIMLVAGGMSYLAGGLWLAMQGLTRREAQAS